ncbi:MAG: hypothetical protein NC230_09115 [Bacteroides sp.]|nr:hypothetical protein [Bacteroides sp.]
MKTSNALFAVTIGLLSALLLGWIEYRVTGFESMRTLNSFIVGIGTFVLIAIAIGWNNGTRGSQVIRATASFICPLLFVVNLLLGWLVEDSMPIIIVNGLVFLCFITAAFKVHSSGE